MPALRLVAGSLAVLTLAGCGRIGELAGMVGSGAPPSAMDAHVVYDARIGCGTLSARTLTQGYTILTPQEMPVPVELTGVFEGPAREGESVFRYTSPADSETWASPSSVVVDVQAIGLDLPAARVALNDACGVPEDYEIPSDSNVPRIPGQ